mmetsp:Transcript_12902/g.30499  ORF Transcript_12902/g.30499 Transcript_12902/m.30499 type:complete len:1175 (-) Transcript_12902:33-3557(-)
MNGRPVDRDDFLGLDIDIVGPAGSECSKKKKPRTTTKSAGGETSRKKRSRSTTAANARNRRPKKPKPPPAPPPSLVSLLKKDASVRRYFQSLQENLDYDVDKWKHEAQRWREIANGQCSELPIAEPKSNGKHAYQRKRARGGENLETGDEDDEPPQDGRPSESIEAVKGQMEGDTIPITDETLFGEFGSDSENSDGDGTTEEIARQSAPTENEFIHNPRLVHTLTKLMEAKSSLDLLGVSLVEIEVKSSIARQEHPNCPARLDATENSFQGRPEDDAETEIETPEARIERSFHVQSDEKVASDILASLRTLIKASSCIVAEASDAEAENARQTYHPFCREGRIHTPTIYYARNLEDDHVINSTEKQHPASIGLKHVIDVLTIFDIYCGDHVSDDEWAEIFTGCNDHSADDAELAQILQRGFRNRCHISECMLSSLDKEIMKTWALDDRASNLCDSTLHFHPADVDCTDAINKYSPKSYNRLVNLEERIAHARIGAVLHFRRGEFQKASEIVVGYVMSTAPSIEAEDYPKLQPAMSMCVLEALLSPEYYLPASSDCVGSSTAGGWFEEAMAGLFGKEPVLLQSLAFAVMVSKNIWNERSHCSDARIRDVALIELAAYERIRRKVDGNWINALENTNGEEMSKVGERLLRTVTTLANSSPEGTAKTKPRAALIISCKVILLTISDGKNIADFINSIAAELSDNSRQLPARFLLSAYCVVHKSIATRKWETLKANSHGGRHTAAAYLVKESSSSPVLDELLGARFNRDDHLLIYQLIECFMLLGDGTNLKRLAKKMLSSIVQSQFSNGRRDEAECQTMKLILNAASLPTVRVINLERRPDRALNFFAGAIREELVVMKGPRMLQRRSIEPSRQPFSPHDQEEHGFFAFDGQCSREELESQLDKRLLGKGRLSDFVVTKWRPSELKAFDRNARDDFAEVHSSMTERACALSHISSWMGVESSLTLKDGGHRRHEYDANWYEQNLLQMFEISGFASGPALLNENANMEPAPVCVILEDDAVLVDRFAERLSALLEELPRDFHFCSLGYSRPKTAPMVEFSSQLGLPTCIWYLTGYVLSLGGARHLLQGLPVKGPVDSWMALKICANWENKFGDRIGVGKEHVRTHKAPLPPRKDLVKILKFRAFAALTPLCAQKVDSSIESTTTRGGWRNKDTDITFSG